IASFPESPEGSDHPCLGLDAEQPIGSGVNGVLAYLIWWEWHLCIGCLLSPPVGIWGIKSLNLPTLFSNLNPPFAQMAKSGAVRLAVLGVIDHKTLLASIMGPLLLLAEPVLGVLFAERLWSLPPGVELAKDFFACYGKEVSPTNVKNIAAYCM